MSWRFPRRRDRYRNTRVLHNVIRPFRQPEPCPLETREKLSEQYWRELDELLREGEISSATAEQIRADLFEPITEDQLPRLRLSVWDSHVQQREEALSGQGDEPSAAEIWKALRDRPKRR